MKFNYSNKTVVITGGTSGIGLAAAKLLGKSGANVAICGKNESKLEAALNSLLELGIRAIGVACDVTSREQVFAFAETVKNEFGKIDVWVNNAGDMKWVGGVKIEEALVHQQIDVNLKSVIWGSQAAFQHMRDHGGVIVNAGSFAGVIPGVGNAIYAASKAAVINLTKSLAAEMGPYNIRVVGYAPGLVDTGMISKKDPEKKVANIAIHRIGQPEEVASLIAFLASDAAGFIDGTCVEISGGKFAAQNIPEVWDSENRRLYDSDNLPPRLQ